ncbi:NirD/YgiW/YdeI family stress tolerance protein [Lelliottia aquatilis]|nr:NirD/YgiW/YdeI family stress tolerance protein [Lelliottia aquatilis]
MKSFVNDPFLFARPAKQLCARSWRPERKCRATLSVRCNLLRHNADYRYIFHDKTDTIDVIIPKAVFDGRDVQPDQMININGSLDKKMSPPVVRIDRLQK